MRGGVAGSEESTCLETYRKHISDTEMYPAADLAAALLDFFTIQKAIYEVDYELSNRPAWLGIPVRGILNILDKNEDGR